VKSPTRVIYVTPQGSVFNQQMAEELAAEEDLLFLCGHYEGIDERVLEEVVTDYVSIGDYVLTGGELPAMVMIDAIARLVPGVLNNDESAMTESFGNGLLEYPQYSRPQSWRGKEVPPVLLSGNHKLIEEWRLEQSMERTKQRRPELYEKWRDENRALLEERERKQKKKQRRAELKMRKEELLQKAENKRDKEVE
jgi:tRNA (guanine37-N1)-methyltransferase